MPKVQHIHEALSREQAARRYRDMRQRLGSQARVAKALGVSERTLTRRELGQTPVTREMDYALSYLLATWRR